KKVLNDTRASANAEIKGITALSLGLILVGTVDKILDDTDTANRFFFKNREVGIMTSVASLGLIHRWDIEYGLSQCDRFLYSNDDYVRAGTLLAIGIICAGVQDPCDPASAILMDHIQSERQCMRIGSIFGLGLAYANSKRDTVIRKEEGGVIFELKKVLNDTRASANAEIKGMTALSLGLILVGTGDHEVANEMLTLLMERMEIEFTNHNWTFVGLGIALIYLGTQQRSEVLVESLRSLPEPFGSMIATLVDVCAYAGTQQRSEVLVESLRSLPEPFGSMIATLVDVCAYAGTGNVLKIQNLLYICSEREPEAKTEKKSEKETPKKKDKPDEKEKVIRATQQGVAVLGIGLIAMGEEIGSQMATRMFANLMRYGEPCIRRAVPLALALLSISNPQLNVLETLSKYSHDSDAETARNAIFAMGL
uniref:26S proteasome non-ATPase regulatory subunit 2 n=1 Tax=Panagrolaimus sp. PS1159 TaxID=55785 RepID=A0AC35F8K3_9BILA